MNHISDVMYYADISSQDKGQGIYNIVYDLKELANGQDGFLDGCVVQMVISTSQQIFFNLNGGKFGAGFLDLQKSYNTNTNTKFLLEWAGSGYYLWPLNGDKTVQLFADVDDGTINGSNNGQGIPGKYVLEQRIYKLSNVTASGRTLNTNLTVSCKYGNFTMGVDNNKIKVGSGLAPVNIKFMFVKLGLNAWKLLFKDFNVSSRCCFSGNDMAMYDNFTDACKDAGYQPNTDMCNGVIPKFCSTTVNGYDDALCKSWCTTNPKDCYNSINDWCQQTKNLDKSVCNCFNKAKFEKFKTDFYKKCGPACKVSDLTAGCYLPACLASGMNAVARQGEQCPDNVQQSCIQKLSPDGNISADKVIMLCQLGSDTSGEDTSGGGGTPSGGGGTPSGGNGTPSGGGSIIAPDSGTPAPSSNGVGDFFSKYQLYIIIGAVVLVLLIVIAMFVAFKK